MRLGLSISDLTFPGGPPALRGNLARIAEAAEAAGFDRISVMDHFWQISDIGPPENEMLEAYTTLGYLVAHTERTKLLAMVTGVVYREPGLLAKAVTTLDVLSGGRAILGIGAAWNEEESRGLGLPFPPIAERFERLEEALQICLQMWNKDDSPYRAKHYTLGRTLSSPQPLSRPHPPILIGGSGERKTLRLVARYAQSCNLFPGPDLVHKLDVLRAHCETEGRDYDEIEKTVMFPIDLSEGATPILARLRELARMGFQVAHGRVADVSSIRPLEVLGKEIIPAASEF